MNIQETQRMLKDTFDCDYNEGKFRVFIANLFSGTNRKGYKDLDSTKQGEYIKESYRSYIQQYKEIAFCQDSQGNKIAVLQVTLQNSTTLQRARTAQRNFVAQYLKDRGYTACLVAFVVDGQSDWRFSLVKRDVTVSFSDKGTLQISDDISPAKRWSFLAGSNEGSHTLQSQFIDVLKSDLSPNLAELEQVFNVEKVTKEFFEKYKELFFGLKENLDQILQKDPEIAKEFASKDIKTVDFAKKTLGQIVFLYFLQKKGWFGVFEGEEWGTGRKNFMREIFDVRQKYGENFFDDVLEPLFYEALATDRGEEALYTKLNNCRMPFLNGGLFAPIGDYSWQTTNITLEDSLFSNDTKTKDGDVGTGIFDVFDRYNFTVNENDPLEKEVAVDPEMLGKVFENLLAIKERKDKGAFYTPREIVHYMCQQSLINYLETNTQQITRLDIEDFVQNSAQIIENDRIALQKIQQEQSKGRSYKGVYKLKLAESIRQNPKEIDNLLANIKVADPAVGSGAFPLGMISEIVKVRQVLNIYLPAQNQQTTHQLKLHAVSNSIYGVDLDLGATEITKLRLWLSLVVDAQVPQPLPNLEHKIMQGNSLVSDYEGIKLFDESIIEQTRKEKLEQDNLGFGRQKQQDFLSFGQTDLEQVADDLQDDIKLFITESQISQKQRLKRQIEEGKWKLIEATLQEFGKTDKLEEVQALRKKNIKPFFIWKLEFADVFLNNGGFDVVIGNPPYVQLQKNGGFLANELQKCGYESFVRSGDIYCLFYELGNQILRQKGHLAFITSNKWMRAGYGEKMRQYLATNTNPKLLIDLGPGVFETATVDTNILLFQKTKTENILCLACDIKVNLVKENIKLETYIKQSSVQLTKLSEESWAILNPLEQKIKEKIEKIGTPLKDWDISINYGIKTGYNEAFIIDGKKKDELIAKDPKSAEIIKPILRGKDIKRYSADFADKWLIATLPAMKLNIDDYPAIKEYFESFGKRMEQIGEKYIENGIEKKTRKKNGNKWFETQDQINYYKEFEKEKIVWGNIAYESSFSFDKSSFINAPANLLTSNNVRVKYLLSILNSKIFSWEFKNLGIPLGRAFEWKKQYVEKIHIPQIPESQQKPFIDKVNQILEITSAENYDPKNVPEEQKNLEKEIDEMVFDLYGLTDEESAIVLGN